MTTINKTVLKLTGEKLTGHLLDYETALNHAYLNIEEGILTVNLSAKFSEEKNCMKVETSITFVAD
ncbi:MAG: hypothetical protein KJ882_05025, partial [Proteobacteria bacterium]|nr:hypothetical protein [Pseudomonadota bacterium]